ncbi:MAG: hypothetical protein RL711_1934 [Bacteroidota bacterium]|jgi:hypothetical protein
MTIPQMLFLVVVFSLLSCRLNKEIDLELPPYEEKTMVECYLEPGKPYRIFLTKSISYFDSLYPVVQNAVITIRYHNQIDTLQFNPSYDTTGAKLYLYQSNHIVPHSYDTLYHLNIEEENGNVITAQTSLLKPVAIDTITTSFSDAAKGNVSIHVRFKDNPLTTDYYRLIVTVNNLIGDGKNSDDLWSDVNLQTSNMVMDVTDRFDKNDTLIVTLAHVSKEFYDFSSSVKQAEKANGNPFVQPSAIKSNVSGNAIGIFAGYTYSRDTIIVK